MRPLKTGTVRKLSHHTKAPVGTRADAALCYLLAVHRPETTENAEPVLISFLP
jgi:hypothetical protein